MKNYKSSNCYLVFCKYCLCPKNSKAGNASLLFPASKKMALSQCEPCPQGVLQRVEIQAVFGKSHLPLVGYHQRFYPDGIGKIDFSPDGGTCVAGKFPTRSEILLRSGFSSGFFRRT